MATASRAAPLPPAMYKSLSSTSELDRKNDHSSPFTMLLTLVIFSFLALQLPEVFGQTFCNGGVLPCVQNAVCDPTTDTCQCATNFFGNGRVACNDATRCTCTALSDPHFGLFDSQASIQTVTANLPCSVTLINSFFVTSASCLISRVYAHPETRGTGDAANLRVFVKEIDVAMLLPSVSFVVNAAGTTVTAGAPQVVTSVNADNFNTATVPTCGNLEVGFNGTYGGAYLNTIAGSYTPPGLCGDCNNVADENVGTSNTTNLAYFLKFLAPVADQKGTYATECGSVQGIVSSTCNDAELTLAGDVCGRYLSDFGLCLISDVSVTTVTSFSTLLTNKFLPCVTGICSTGVATTQCSVLLGDETASCRVGTNPASCP